VLVNFGNRDTRSAKLPARCALARYLDRVTTTPSDSDGGQIVRQQLCPRDLPRVVEVTTYRVLVGHDLDLASFASGDLEDRRGQHEPPESISKPVVVGQDDDLAIRSSVIENSRKTLDLRWVHCLHGVVDDDEPEWAVRCGASWQEQRQSQGVKFTVTQHWDTAVGPVNADRDGEPSSRSTASSEGNRPEVDVALLPQLGPDTGGLLAERGQALIT
jgi:hypothetical protein